LDRKLVSLMAARLAQRHGARAGEFIRERLEHAEEQADALSAQAWQEIGDALERVRERRPAATAASAERGNAAADDLTVLVVDDEPDVLDALVRILKPQHYNVIFADSGAEALRVIEGGVAPDLVLSDIVMPGMSGFSLAHLARQRRPDLKFLFITGYAERASAMPEDRRELGKVLRKPIMPSHLRQEVAALIG
jgi:CheY-like chemotaxis protein